MSFDSTTVSPASRPVKNPPIISLTTDFGTRDPFVGIMKGVILGRCPHALLIDLTHEVPPQDILAGSLALESAYPYFPEGTIHLAVVDPGVGTARAAIAVQTPRATFVAPDNGLLSFLEEAEIVALHSIENPEVMLHPVSHTFHGRDVFAPAAALLACGAAGSRLGPQRTAMTRLPFPQPRVAPGAVRGEILLFDRFGNGVTNIRMGAGSARCVEIADRVLPVVQTYADVPPGHAMALVGSSGRLEVCVRGGSARQTLGLQKHQDVRLVLDEAPT